MKKTLFIALALVLGMCSCQQPKEAKVMARFVPERYDDFVFENNLIAGRMYGEALESCGKGQITSPGIAVWVKTPGALVCNQRYIDDLQNGKSYHKDWGNGKDCYKVARSLGAGASAAIVGGELALPATNFRSWEIVEEGPEKVVFVLNYPEWEVSSEKIALSKKITVVPDTYFCKVEDTYTFSGTERLPVAVGMKLHSELSTVQDIFQSEAKDRWAIWEKASDTGAEPEDGLIGVAVVLPGAESALTAQDHALLVKTVASGEPLRYCVGNCWSKGDIQSAAAWFGLVNGL